jgi:Uma2 family endonuclease
VVYCGEPRFADNQKDTLANPALLVHILSPSTETHDRGLKWAQYRQIESLREYVLVSQSEPRVEVYTRQPDAKWLFAEFTGLDARARFPGVDCEIPMAEIYLGISFDAKV